MNETIRCFIAIELSQEISEALEKIESELKKSIYGVKWVEPHNIHLTLKFLGNTDKENVDDIKKILDEAASSSRPFKIRLSIAGAFPSLSRPRVLWIGIDEGSKESSDLAKLIEDKVADLGVEKESRPFHPHLTLARVNFLKDKDSVKNAFASLKVPQLEMDAKKTALFQSLLSEKGPTYVKLYEAKLVI